MNLPVLDINKKAIYDNLNEIKEKVGQSVQIMPVIKANAYGTGMNNMAEVFKDCEYFGVADINEAMELRLLKPEAKIITLYQPLPTDIVNIMEYNIISSVGDIDYAISLNEEAKKQNRKCLVHVEVDTGTARLGVLPSEVESFAEQLKELNNLIVDGLYTHYAVADSLSVSDLEFTQKQTDLFDEAIQILERIFGHIHLKHACSGDAIFNPCTKLYDMVRPGLILYGYYNSLEFENLVSLKPALKLSAPIIRIKEYDENVPISYGRRFVTKRKSKIATVGIGYADGVSRLLFNKDNKENGCLVVNNQRAPICGTICMDLIMIDITDIKGEVKIGDEVFIFDNENVTLYEIADITKSIGHEVITKLNDTIYKKFI